MSYFLFGQLCFETPTSQENVATRILERAHVFGLVAVSAEEPRLLQEMRAGPVDFPFFLRMKTTDDTSEPLLMSADEASIASSIAAWILAALQTPGLQEVQVWLTDGYNDYFVERQCKSSTLTAVLTELMTKELQPSSLLCIRDGDPG